MKFLSIKEFFYKLNTIGFILLLVPLLTFLFLYYTPATTPEPAITEEDGINQLTSGLITTFIIDLTIVHWVKLARVKKLNKLLEISKKMDGYAGIFLFRSINYTLFSLLASLCFYLTESVNFAGIFLFIIIVTLLQWPSRSAFCRLLNVTANERTMIMTNGDTITRTRTRKSR